MRLMIDSLIALMLVGILAAVVMHHRQTGRARNQQAQVRSALTRLRQQTLYHGALRRGEEGENSPFPARIDPAWFGDPRPTNPLLPPSHPWMDRAAPGENRADPPNPVASDPTAAGFWYNPTRGTFRARVPDQGTEAATLDLYNRINATTLRAFPRQPSAAPSAPNAIGPSRPDVDSPSDPAPASAEDSKPEPHRATLADLPRGKG